MNPKLEARPRHLVPPDANAQLLQALAGHSDDRYVVEVAAHPRTRSELLGRLARHSSPQVRAAAAANPRLPSTSLPALAYDSSTLVLAAIADRPDLDRMYVERLIRTCSPRILRAIAGNRDQVGEMRVLANRVLEGAPNARVGNTADAIHALRLTAEDLDDYCTSPHRHVVFFAHITAFAQGLIGATDARRASVGLAPSVVENLVALVLPKYSPLQAVRVLGALGVNGLPQTMPDGWAKVPEAVTAAIESNLTHLTVDALRRNFTLPPTQLAALAGIADGPFVEHPGWMLERYPYAWREVPGGYYFYGRAVAASHPDTPRDAVEPLFKCRSENIRAAMVWRLDVPTLARAGTSKLTMVRRAVARDTRTAEHILDLLANDIDEDVRLGVGQNPSADGTQRALAMLINSGMVTD